MITIYCHFGHKMPIKTRFDLIKQAGFDGTTLWWGDKFGDTDFRDHPALAQNVGLFVENIHAPYDDINDIWLDNLNGQTLVDNFKGIVEDCSNYNIPAMILHLSSRDNPPPYNEIGLDRTKRIVEKAEKHGVNIAFENLRKAEYLKYVLDQVDSPYAGFCYDSGHHNCHSPHVDLLSRHGSRLMALHLHDNDGTDDQHLLPFDGNIDWAKTMGEISKAGYAGALALEVRNRGYAELSPEEFLHLAFERSKSLEKLRI